MDNHDVDRIAAWLAESGLRGETELTLLNGFCERCRAIGIAVSRAIVIIDTLHPIYEGRGFRWREDETDEAPLLEFKRDIDGAQTEGWQNSPFYHLIQRGGGELRCKLHAGETAGFQAIEELRVEGQTDYFAKVHLFAPDAIIGEMDNLASRWTTAQPGGFSDAEITALQHLTPILGLAIKSASLARVPVAVVEAYLGRDAGRRVLAGRMSRGITEKMNAVLWFSDMRGYTTLSETIASDQLIPLLNDYAEAVISAVHGAGRQCAEADGRRHAGDLHRCRSGRGLLCRRCAPKPTSGNGSQTSTHAGPRRANRSAPSISACTSATSSTAISAARTGSTSPLSARRSTRSAASPPCAAPPTATSCSQRLSARRCRVTSEASWSCVGRYALRGVGRAQELFTLDPELVAGR